MDPYLLGLEPPPKPRRARMVCFNTAISPEIEKRVRVQIPDVVSAIMRALRLCGPMTRPGLMTMTGYKDHQLERGLRSAKHDGLIVGRRDGLQVVYSAASK